MPLLFGGNEAGKLQQASHDPPYGRMCWVSGDENKPVQDDVHALPAPTQKNALTLVCTGFKTTTLAAFRSEEDCARFSNARVISEKQDFRSVALSPRSNRGAGFANEF